MIKLVAFDWNGTLFADTNALVKGLNQVLKLFNLKEATVFDYQKHFDVPVSKTYIGLGISEENFKKNSQLIAETFHATYEPEAIKVRTRANTRKVLQCLHQKRIPSLIFSNHIEDKIILQLERLKIDKYFSTILANCHIQSVHKTRFKKEKLKEYIKIKKLRSIDVLIIGDTTEEIEIGKELGCPTIAITNGSCSVSRLNDAKPDFLISNLSEIIPIIQTLNK